MKSVEFPFVAARGFLATIFTAFLIMAILLTLTIRWLLQVARTDVEGDAFLVSSKVSVMVNRHDNLAQLLAKEWEIEDNPVLFKTYASLINRESSLAPQIAIADSKGLVVQSSRPGSVGVDISDREHFRVHAENRVDGLYVSDPVIGRTTNRSSIQFTHRIDRYGSFAGIVSLSLSPDALFVTDTAHRNGSTGTMFDRPQIQVLVSSRNTRLAILATEKPPDRFDDWAAKVVSDARSTSGNSASKFFLHGLSIWRVGARVIPDTNIVVLVASTSYRFVLIGTTMLSIAVFALGWIVVLLYMAAQSAHRESTAAFSEFLEKLLYHVPTRIGLFDAEGALIFSNRQNFFTSAVHYVRRDKSQPLEPVVDDMNEVDRPEFLKWYHARRDSDFGGSDSGYLYWIRKPEKSDVAIVLKWTRIEAAGKTMECWTALDVTELMQAQLFVQHSAKLALIGEMAAGLAHEINQPLNVIALASQNLVDLLATSCNACQRFGNTEKINRKLEKIGRQIERAAKIINNLRIFSRRDRLEVEKLDIPEQWGIAVDFVGHLLKHDVIALDTTIHPGKIEAVVNRGALQQIFVNLLTNACDSVASCRRLGEGHIGCSIKSDERTGSAVITIEDNGAGFPKIVLDRLFEPFVTTKPRGKGTGLGLSIAHNIISEMGGSISVANKAPRTIENDREIPQPAGAVVTVILPLAKAGTR